MKLLVFAIYLELVILGVWSFSQGTTPGLIVGLCLWTGAIAMLISDDTHDREVARREREREKSAHV